eukprot:GDKJ01029356.1.p1 GENE.GDKJ01029356.1~~GDKJ01029356.1.p1  ORF type:complete len:599 (-),score=104.68 GDKJ01029356.1:125-1888(-)
MKLTEKLNAATNYALSGICDIVVLSGVIYVHGARFTPESGKVRFSQYPWDRPWNVTAENNTCIETIPIRNVFGAPNYALLKSDKTIKIVDSWIQNTEALESLPQKPLVISVKGGRNTGKSTYLRYVINKLLTDSKITNREMGLYYVETDVGQSEIGIPGQMAVYHITSPLTETAHSNVHHIPIGSVFYGDISTSDNPEAFLIGVSKLRAVLNFHCTQEGAKTNEIPVLINTSGWDSGLGRQLSLCVDRIFGVNAIVQMGRDTVTENRFGESIYDMKMHEISIYANTMASIGFPIQSLQLPPGVSIFKNDNVFEIEDTIQGDKFGVESAPANRANRNMRMMTVFNPLFKSCIHFFPITLSHDSFFGSTLEQVFKAREPSEVAALTKRVQNNGSCISASILSVILDCSALKIGFIGLDDIEHQHYSAILTGQIVGLCISSSSTTDRDHLMRENGMGEMKETASALSAPASVDVNEKQTALCVGLGYVKAYDVQTRVMQLVLSTNTNLNSFHLVDSIICGHPNIQTIFKEDAISKNWYTLDGKPIEGLDCYLTEGLVANTPYTDVNDTAVTCAAGRVLTARRKGVERYNK